MRESDWSSDVCSSDLFPSHDKVDSYTNIELVDEKSKNEQKRYIIELETLLELQGPINEALGADIIGIEPTELTDKLGKVDALSTDFGSFKTATEAGISGIKQALAALAGGGQQKQQQQQQQQQQEEQFDHGSD